MSEWSDGLAITDIPYISHLPNDGREPVLSSFYDNKTDKWYTYLSDESLSDESKCIALYVKDVEGTYVALRPKDQRTDLQLPFSETIQKHFSLPEVARYLPELERDVTNSLTSILKYFVLLDYATRVDTFSAQRAAAQMVASEIEYAFTNHRSAYDLINRVVQGIRGEYQEELNALPDSFRRVTQKAPEDLGKKYHLPDEMIEFYKGNEEPFMTLRKVRDNFLHHGKSVRGIMYRDEEGFAITTGSDLAETINDLQLWDEDKARGNLQPLLPLMAFLASDLIDTLKSAAKAMYFGYDDILPQSVYGSDYHVYFRSSMNELRLNLDYFMDEQWVLPEEVLAGFQS